jgi:hypothetical protein
VVVLAVPPFWFAIAITFIVRISSTIRWVCHQPFWYCQHASLSGWLALPALWPWQDFDGETATDSHGTGKPCRELPGNGAGIYRETVQSQTPNYRDTVQRRRRQPRENRHFSADQIDVNNHRETTTAPAVGVASF